MGADLLIPLSTMDAAAPKRDAAAAVLVTETGSGEIIGFYYLTLFGATATFASAPAAGASPIMG